MFLQKYISNSNKKSKKCVEKYYYSIIKIWLAESEKINKRFSTSWAKRMIVESSTFLGIYRLKYLFKALRFCKLIVLEEKTVQSRYELAECYSSIGHFCSRFKKHVLKRRGLFIALAEASNRKGVRVLYEIMLDAEASEVQKDKINLQNKINYIIYKIKLFHVKHFSKYLFNILMINFQNKVSRETIIKL